MGWQQILVSLSIVLGDIHPSIDNLLYSTQTLTYTYSTFRSLMLNGTSSNGEFVVDPDLERLDADTYLIFLSGNGVVSSVPINDPWYRFDAISDFIITQVATNESVPAYQASEAASPLGCASQWQLCKGSIASNESCGPLTSFNDAWGGAAPLFGVETEATYTLWADELMKAYAADEDASRFLWLERMITNSQADIISIVNKLDSQSLESSRGLAGGLQGPLPDDQWKIDVSYWWNITLAVLQATFVERAYGSTNPDILRLQINATNAGQNSICQNQVREILKIYATST